MQANAFLNDLSNDKTGSFLVYKDLILRNIIAYTPTQSYLFT